MSRLSALAAFGRDRPRTVLGRVNRRPRLGGCFPVPIPLGNLVVKSGYSDSLLEKFTKIHLELTPKCIFVPLAEKFPYTDGCYKTAWEMNAGKPTPGLGWEGGGEFVARRFPRAFSLGVRYFYWLVMIIYLQKFCLVV